MQLYTRNNDIRSFRQFLITMWSCQDYNASCEISNIVTDKRHLATKLIDTFNNLKSWWKMMSFLCYLGFLKGTLSRV